MQINGTDIGLFTSWLKAFPPHLWNCYHCHILNNASYREELISMANNPIERFNREANSIFGVHPGMLEFVKKVKEISVKYLDMVKDVELDRAPKPNREPNNPQLPDDYFEFRTIKLNTRVQPAPPVPAQPQPIQMAPVTETIRPIPVLSQEQPLTAARTSQRTIKRPRALDE